ncbi:cysteine hydrolase [Pseudaminobacter sp. 19-2017]|uniref:Cysteine hydrolase n=1 Tax=Pseudaminobacter soli (ex Zhang et al. 2022) TaxID=2831468 RepID=A0A942E5X3_9HYPH|nr:isochorismatase family cysteine hydrolase [Pseudaminobacter soli]MBS3651728.1 cysteine hydrolase [Pseudaminobacter soli]
MTPASADIPLVQRVMNPALLIVDMQNDFVRAGAPLEVAEARSTIAPIQRLAGAFRQLGRPVIYTRFLAEQSPGLMWLWSPQCGSEVKCCWPGVSRRYQDTPGELECAAVIDELSPAAGDPIVDKYGYGSFHNTQLDALLRERGVQSLVVTGTVAQICVEQTAREAFHYGYRTTVVSDGVSSFDHELKAAALKNFAMKFGWVADSETVIGWLGQAA